MTSIAVRSASRDEDSAVTALITLAFAADPMARWSLRDPQIYLSVMPELIRAFGSAAYDSASAHVSEDFGGAAMWLPPGVEPDIETLDRLIRENADPAIDGILVQLPLPAQIDEGKVIQAISPDKDVDGFHVVNVGRLGAGKAGSAFVPCTPAGAMLLIESERGRDLSGLNAVVIGRSNIVGKPMANLLLAANATVTIAHSRTRNLPDIARGADILVAAVGRPEIVRGDWIKPSAVVIDAGYNDGNVGDVAFHEALERANLITPVPGGVGPMTIATLIEQTVEAAHRQAELE